MPPPKRGQVSQVGFADETTYGTPVTVTRFFEFVKETIKLDVETMLSKGLRAGRLNENRSGGYLRHRKGAKGTIDLELMQKGSGYLLKHMWGSVVTSGTNPYLHVATPATLVGDSFTCQVGRDDIPFTYEGGKINGWEMSAEVGSFLNITLELDFEDENTAIPLAIAAYPTNLRPYSWLDGYIRVANVEYPIKGFSLKCENNLATERYFMKSSNAGRKSEPSDQNRNWTGTITAEFDALTLYNLFTAGTEVSLRIDFATGADACVVEMPTVLFTGETPTVEGPEIIPLSLPYTVLGDSHTMTIINSEAVA